MAKQKGLSAGISKLYEQQVIALGKSCPSMISEDYELFHNDVQNLVAKYGRCSRIENKYYGFTVAPPYTESEFDISRFINQCHRVNSKYISRLAYSFEVGEAEGSDNIHCHFLVEVSGYPSKVQQYFKEHFKDYIRNSRSLVSQRYPEWKDDYLKKMYSTKEALIEKYKLEAVYYC